LLGKGRGWAGAMLDVPRPAGKRIARFKHLALLLVLSAGSCAIHLQTGSIAGAAPYVFCLTLLLCFGIVSRAKGFASYHVSMVGIVEGYFILDYVIYGTMVCAQQFSKVPLGSTMQDAYSDGYWVGAASLLCFAVGVRICNWAQRDRVPLARTLRARETSICRTVFGVFVALGIVSLVVLLTDPNVRNELLYQHIGIVPAVGMGRYSAAVFILPSVAAALLYVSTVKRDGKAGSKFRRFLLAAMLVGLSLIHLAQGRRLMWLCALLLAVQFGHLGGLFRLRTWVVLVSIPGVIVTASYFEASKNTGLRDIASIPEKVAITSGDAILRMIQNSVGRFDTSAALIANRQQRGYYLGLTFVESVQSAMPSAMRGEERYNLRLELADLIYGPSRRNLMSEEGSLVAEAFANFGYAGALIVFLPLGYLCAYLDRRFQHVRSPIAAVGYAFALFRVGHHLVTVSHSALPLTVDLFVPWVVALLAMRLFAGRARAPRAVSRGPLAVPPNLVVIRAGRA